MTADSEETAHRARLALIARQHLRDAGITCTQCARLADTYARLTDIVRTPSWPDAVREEGDDLLMEGIMHRAAEDDTFCAILGAPTGGYGASASGACPACGRAWSYYADLHFGAYRGWLRTRVARRP